MKCVVFGGSGFLGEFLVRELINVSYSVTIADIHAPKFKGEFNFIKADVLHSSEVESAISKDTDFVINLAGFANLDNAANNPYRTMELNVLGNIRILECLVNKKNIKRYVYASSAYAVSSKGSFYGISKLASEKVTEEYGRKYHIPYSIIRYGSVYAERDYSNNYIYQLLKKCVETKKIIHEGSGDEIREYIHAADASRLTRQVMEHKEFDKGHIILTGMERMKRAELFNMIKEILGDEVEIVYENIKIKNHYKSTPYSFSPSFNRKLVANPFIDIGQGIVACLEDISINE